MIDRDYAPYDAALEKTQRISTEELAEALDEIYEGGGKISAAEGQALLSAMITPLDRLTSDQLDGLNRYFDLDTDQKQYYDLVEQTIGFPTDDEYVAIEPMDPMKMEWYIHSERGRIEKNNPRRHVLNNEFKFFTIEPYDLTEYPVGIAEKDFFTLACATNPARLRLEAAFPGLSQTLYEYGRKPDGSPKRMGEFYDGLIEPTSESRRMLVLFAIADSLMQRFVRPNDEVYQAELLSISEASWNHQDPRPVIPKYDDVPDNPAKAVKIAHHTLWR